jgi:hypothetical protein
MVDFPFHVPRQSLVSSNCGFHVLYPLWSLILSLGQWVRIRSDLAKVSTVTTTTNDVAINQWRIGMEFRQAALKDDIHDLRYLCYSQAKLHGVRVAVNDLNLANAKRNVDAYLRSFDQLDIFSEADRETATDHFIEIGLYARGPVIGPRYDIPEQFGWN